LPQVTVQVIFDILYYPIKLKTQPNYNTDSSGLSTLKLLET